MGLRAIIQNRVARRLFSAERRNAKRRKIEKARRAQNAPHVVEYYHELGDPYSHLMAQVLPEVCRRYDIELKTHIVAPPPDWAAPDRSRLQDYSRKDAERLAARAGLEFIDPGQQPSAAALAAGWAALVEASRNGTFLEQAASIGAAVWSDSAVPPSKLESSDIEQSIQAATAQRDSQGHYLGATVFYGGEWYWGVDRLHYLERRLTELGAAKGDTAAPIFAPPIVPSSEAVAIKGDRPVLHWYVSFRSPYTGIVADRVKALADAYGAELKVRYVLPMVMRGMEVRRTKGFYIMGDTVREAERMGIPFGNMFDPVGAPVERGYAILHKAIELGKGYDFARSFLSGVWADGIDAGSDGGLKKITERAGLSWDEMRGLIGTDDWRADEEVNQTEMFAHGVWGVPSFRVGNVAAWGQDRLWVIEDALKTLSSANV